MVWVFITLFCKFPVWRTEKTVVRYMYDSTSHPLCKGAMFSKFEIITYSTGHHEVCFLKYIHDDLDLVTSILSLSDLRTIFSVT